MVGELGESFDVPADYAAPMPVYVIADLLGVPREDHVRLRAWAQALVHTYEPAVGAFPPAAGSGATPAFPDDVRLVLTVLGEAERVGAVSLNGADVTEILFDNGRAAGVAFTEADSGERIEVRADAVINATGVWADRIRPEEVVEEEVFS